MYAHYINLLQWNYTGCVYYSLFFYRFRLVLLSNWKKTGIPLHISNVSDPKKQFVLKYKYYVTWVFYETQLVKPLWSFMMEQTVK